MSKKGLNFDEKKARMVQLLYEKQVFFQLKELEKLAPKEKGIVQNSVKDVVQALVDEGTIDTDKIGGSIYYWAFPSKAKALKKRKLEQLQSQLEVSSKKLTLVRQSVERIQEGQNQEETSLALQSEIQTLEAEKENYTQLLKAGSDVEKLEDMKNQIQPLKEAANRWTDNIFAVKSWCKKKFMIEENVLNKQFQLPEDLDYIE